MEINKTGGNFDNTKVNKLLQPNEGESEATRVTKNTVRNALSVWIQEQNKKSPVDVSDRKLTEKTHEQKHDKTENWSSIWDTSNQ